MNIHKQLRDFLAKKQQQMRQQNRFGDLQSGITLEPSRAKIKSLQELIISFTNEPDEYAELLQTNAEFLQYISTDFIEQMDQLSEFSFYDQLAYLLSMPNHVHQGFNIIAGAISPISNFTDSILNNISIFRSKLLINFFEAGIINTQSLQRDNQDRKLNLFEVIDEFLATITYNHEDIIYATEKCVSSILSVRTDEMKEYIELSKWDVLNSVIRRIHMDIYNTALIHHDVSLLIEIIENPYLITSSVVNFAQKLVLADNNSIEDPKSMLADSLVLLSKVCVNLQRFTAQLANKTLMDRLIFLLMNGDETIKVYTINVIIQICSGLFPKSIDMLYTRGLLDLLVKFAQEFPDKADQSFIAACSICTHGPTYVQYICESEFIDLIHLAVTEGTYDTQLSAIYLVSDIIRFGAIEHIRQINDPQIINAMIQLLEEGCIGSDCILFSLNEAMNPETESFDSTFKDALCIPQFIELLPKLCESEDQSVSELAGALYQRFADDSTS